MESLNKDHLGGCILHEAVGDINTWSPCVWDMLLELTGAKSVVDVGCGVGYSLQYFVNKGLSCIGVDGLEDVLQHSTIPNLITIHDYTKGSYILKKPVDLAWSCEFVEHVEEEFMENFMKTFDGCAYVAMTHALPNQPGYHHVNCQPSQYWINAFTNRGFRYLESETKILKDCLIGKPYGHWVRNSLMLFKNEFAANKRG
jgi:SAM-dependent methyltransferase